MLASRTDHANYPLLSKLGRRKACQRLIRVATLLEECKELPLDGKHPKEEKMAKAALRFAVQNAELIDECARKCDVQNPVFWGIVDQLCQIAKAPRREESIGECYGFTSNYAEGLDPTRRFTDRLRDMALMLAPSRTDSKKVPWEDEADGYLPNSEAIKLTDDHLNVKALGKLLKLDGEMRYMRKARRCKVNVTDLTAYVKRRWPDIPDSRIDEYWAGVEKRKVEAKAKKQREQ